MLVNELTHTVTPKRSIRQAFLAVACAFVVLMPAALMAGGSAWAEETTLAEALAAGAGHGDYAALSLDDLNKLVEMKTADLANAQALQADCEGRISANQARAADLDARLPVAESLADRSVRERYKIQQHRGGVLEAVVSATDFKSFMAAVEYIEAASEVSVDAVVELREEKADCEREAVALSEEMTSIEQQVKDASEDLQRATEARDEAQRKADMVANAHLNPDGADWNAGEEAFVAAWAPRIDAFLGSSPMQGQGAAFAKAAWACHIDPRFSPAISTIESGKGRVCIRPYNAWGWGAADSNPRGLAKEWSSWEEAINAHVSGLARGYGYTVSTEGAQKYCPYNWEEWYATTVSEMNSI